MTHNKKNSWHGGIFFHVSKDEKNGWKIITYEQKDEQNLFTTKNYVAIQTLLIHNQEICVNQNTTCLFPKGMFPL